MAASRVNPLLPISPLLTTTRVRQLDKHEDIVADSGPAQVRDFEEAWTAFLERARSGFRAPASIRDTLRRRLNNLLDRHLIERERARYTVTDDGLSHLGSSAPPAGPRQIFL